MSKSFLLVIFILGFIWIRSGYGKLTGGFVGNLDKALMKFASENPYPFVKDFLNSFAIPNHIIFSYLTQFGEIFAGLTLAICSVVLIANPKSSRLFLILLALGLLVGAFLNLTFWFSAGWMSPSTDGLNLLMFAIEVIALLAVLKKIKAN